MTTSTRLTSYSHDGLTFDVIDEGPLDGDPVVLLHGFPETSSAWHKVSPLLHAHGLRTYAPNQRGYSPGARPRRRRDYRMRLLAGDVAALVERIGRPIHLVGHDWGSAVGWAVATLRPDLLRTFTAVSVPHPLSFVQAMLTSRQIRLSWYMFAFQLPALPEQRLADPAVDVELRKGGMSEADVDRYRREIVAGGALRGALMWYRAMFVPDLTLWRHRVRVPTTFVWSDRDVAVSQMAGRRNERYMAAPYRAVNLRGVSHWIPTEAPEQLADVVLERVASS